MLHQKPTFWVILKLKLLHYLLIGGQGVSRKLNRSSTSVTNPFYNVQINDDIYLIERVESILPQTSANHDPYCPFCLRCN